MAITKANECVPYYSPGEDISAYVGVAVTGKRFVRVSANRQAGPALNTSASGGNVTIAPATAAVRGALLGVAAYDGAVGDIIPVIASPGAVVPVTASGVIAAGAQVEVGTGGVAVTIAAGVAVGVCLSGAVDAGDAQIKLY